MMKIKRIFLAKNAVKNKRAWEIIKRFNPAKVREVDDVLATNEYLEKFKDPWLEGKQSLLLCKFPGRFFEPCPCTKEYLNCGYFNLSPVVGCPVDCSYCILQGYLTAFPIQVYVNLEDLFGELEKFLKKRPRSRLRLGTGELADSLALEPELGYAKTLIEYFREKKNFIFELKTKTSRIELFKGLKASGQIVVSWSVNPEEAAGLEEKSAADIGSRLNSAAALANAGWPVGFHFDPMLDFVSEEKYLALIDKIFEMVPASKISFISLGMLRFPPSLRPVLKDRHPQSRILCGELFPGKDGKLRYLRPVREKIYKALISRIRAHSEKILVYLCMEPRWLWEKMLGDSPALIKKELALPLSERTRFRPG
jgi:spore photoproduct lyase